MMSSPTSRIVHMYGELFDLICRLMAYLHNPSPSSWVVRVAAGFRILALVLIFPWIFLTLLDVASYLIVRTLGADSAHRVGETPEGTALTLSFDSESRKPPKTSQLAPPNLFVTGANGNTESEPYLSTSSEGNAALSGEGIFSPPASRSNSPPILRHCGASGNGKNNSLRKRT